MDIIKYLDDVFYIVFDCDGNIIDFSSLYAVKKYKDILLDSHIIKNDEECEYYLKSSNEWFSESVKLSDDKKIKIFRDITKYKIRERSLQIDKITGLPNRELLNALINNAIEEEINNNNSFSILFCDIDHFKQVNDIYGHECGDFILNKVGEKLNNNDFISGRHGGEEFLILIKNVDDDNTNIIANNIRKDINNNSYKYGENNISVSISIGYYNVGCEELLGILDIDDFRSIVLKKADIAMYQAKKNGRNTVVGYKSMENIPKRIIHVLN